MSLGGEVLRAQLMFLALEFVSIGAGHLGIAFLSSLGVFAVAAFYAIVK